jgi:hypothetical protein
LGSFNGNIGYHHWRWFADEFYSRLFQEVNMERKKRIAVVLMVCLFMAACIGALGQARTDTTKFNNDFITADTAYRALIADKSLTQTQKDYVNNVATPAMTMAKARLVTLNEAVKIWQSSGAKPADYADLVAAFKSANTAAQAAITAMPK